MRVAVVGAAGQLGRVTAARWAAAHEVVGLTRADVDLTDSAALDARLMAIRPALVINCSAFTNVDAAEDAPAVALAVNAVAVRTLAAVAARLEATLVHYSTDFVFDGVDRTTPYTEDDPPRPQSVYATSKLLGEWLAAGAPRHYVLRVESLFGGAYARSSIDKLIAGLRAGDELRVFADRSLTPSYVDDVASATERIVTLGAPSGVYHCVNTGVTDWLTLTRELAAWLGVADRARLVPVAMSSLSLKARRPQYCALSNAKLRAAGVEMPEWRDALRRYLALSGGGRPQGPSRPAM
jgi:dTDP-4-dehydrorhamnose reductase